MQTITAKLARVISAAPAGWTKDDCRHLIHGTGGSPRRARRLLKTNPMLAATLRDAYIAAIDNGKAHTQAVLACSEMYLHCSGLNLSNAPVERDDEADDTGSGTDSEGGEADITKLAPAATKTKGKDLGALRQLALAS